MQIHVGRRWPSGTYQKETKTCECDRAYKCVYVWCKRNEGNKQQNIAKEVKNTKIKNVREIEDEARHWLHPRKLEPREEMEREKDTVLTEAQSRIRSTDSVWQDTSQQAHMSDSLREECHTAGDE